MRKRHPLKLCCVNALPYIGNSFLIPRSPLTTEACLTNIVIKMGPKCVRLGKEIEQNYYKKEHFARSTWDIRSKSDHSCYCPQSVARTWPSRRQAVLDLMLLNNFAEENHEWHLLSLTDAENNNTSRTTFQSSANQAQIKYWIVNIIGTFLVITYKICSSWWVIIFSGL